MSQYPRRNSNAFNLTASSMDLRPRQPNQCNARVSDDDEDDNPLSPDNSLPRHGSSIERFDGGMIGGGERRAGIHFNVNDTQSRRNSSTTVAVNRHMSNESTQQNARKSPDGFVTARTHISDDGNRSNANQNLRDSLQSLHATLSDVRSVTNPSSSQRRRSAPTSKQNTSYNLPPSRSSSQSPQCVVSTDAISTEHYRKQLQRYHDDVVQSGGDAAQINYELNKIILRRLEDIDSISGGDANTCMNLRLITFQEWVDLLLKINSLIFSNIAQMEAETFKRLREYFCKASSESQESDCENRKLRKDMCTLIKIIQNGYHRNCWNFHGLCFETLTITQVIGSRNHNPPPPSAPAQSQMKMQAIPRSPSPACCCSTVNMGPIDMEQALRTLAHEIARKHDEICELRNQIFSLEQEIQKAHQKILLKDETNACLKEEVEDLQRYITQTLNMTMTPCQEECKEEVTPPETNTTEEDTDDYEDAVQDLENVDDSVVENAADDKADTTVTVSIEMGVCPSDCANEYGVEEESTPTNSEMALDDLPCTTAKLCIEKCATQSQVQQVQKAGQQYDQLAMLESETLRLLKHEVTDLIECKDSKSFDAEQHGNRLLRMIRKLGADRDMANCRLKNLREKIMDLKYEDIYIITFDPCDCTLTDEHRDAKMIEALTNVLVYAQQDRVNMQCAQCQYKELQQKYQQLECRNKELEINLASRQLINTRSTCVLNEIAELIVRLTGREFSYQFIYDKTPTPCCNPFISAIMELSEQHAEATDCTSMESQVNIKGIKEMPKPKASNYTTTSF